MELEHVRRESKRVEFKAEADFSSFQGCCEIITDIVALADSGGGVILIGMKDNGEPSGFDVTAVMSFDPAKLTDKMASFTGEHYADFDFGRLIRDGHEIAAIHLQGVYSPMVFEKEGVYAIGEGKKAAFAKGTVYFRHGAKSEPAMTADLRQAIEREFERRRKTFLGDLRKVVAAPLGSTVHVISPKRRGDVMPTALPIRLVHDPSAPAFRQVDTDATYPFRQKELVEIVNQRIGGVYHVNTHDLQCVRRVYGIDKQPLYFHKPKFGSPQYSLEFVDWLVHGFLNDPALFTQARQLAQPS
jgi:schlafen family protein